MKTSSAYHYTCDPLSHLRWLGSLPFRQIYVLLASANSWDECYTYYFYWCFLTYKRRRCRLLLFLSITAGCHIHRGKTSFITHDIFLNKRRPKIPVSVTSPLVRAKRRPSCQKTGRRRVPQLWMNLSNDPSKAFQGNGLLEAVLYEQTDGLKSGIAIIIPHKTIPTSKYDKRWNL